MKHGILVLILVIAATSALLLLTPLRPSANTAIENSEIRIEPAVRSALETTFNRKNFHQIPTGDIKLIEVRMGNERLVSFAEDKYSLKLLDFLQAWEKLGFVDIEVEDLATNRFNMKDFIAMSQEGLRKRVKITPLPAGISLHDKDGPSLNEKSLSIYFSTTKLDEIVEAKEHEKGADLFLIIKGTFKTEYTKQGLEFLKIIDEQNLENGKFIALLKHDPFEKRWLLSALDVAPIDGSFSSNRVNEALSQ